MPMLMPKDLIIFIFYIEVFNNIIVVMDISFEVFFIFLADRYSVLKLKISFKVFGSTVNFSSSVSLAIYTPSDHEKISKSRTF